LKAVILAGGKGRRLEPYTTLLPKPLMPVGEYPVVEILIRQLRRSGFTDLYFAVGHLAGLIEAYFQGGEKWGVQIHYSVEEEPLGTVGPLTLLRKELEHQPFLVVNGDILTDLNFAKVLETHQQSGATLTLAVTHREVAIDFGVLELEGTTVVGFREKPVLRYPVSMGVYAMHPRVFEYIPENQKFDLPDLVWTLIQAREPVQAYFYEGFWLDIGREEDWRRAQEEFEKRREEIL